MAIRWERFAGDTSRFALRMAFARDPDHGRGTELEIGLSWGGIQLWVEGKNLCAHQEEGEPINSVHWYLLPVIEWFVQHWNPLFHEERLPSKNAGDTAWASLRTTRFPPSAIEADEQRASNWEEAWQAWWARHALRAAREGGLFPDVVLRRIRDLVEVSWGPARGQGMLQHFDFVYAGPGSCRLPPAAIAEPLYEVLSSASTYLLSLAPESRRLNELCSALDDLKALAEPNQRLMWLAGLGTDEQAVQTGWQRALETLSEIADAPRRAMLNPSEESTLVINGSCHAALMFGSLAPTVDAEDVLCLARTMVDLYSPDGEPDGTHSIAGTTPCQETMCTAWSQGYLLAEELHQSFDMQFVESEFVNIHGLIEFLGISISEARLSDRQIRGVSISGPQHKPGIMVNADHPANQSASGVRFTLAHELCHLLFDREKGRQLAIASGPWAPRDVERRANAFAAMLLMPPCLVHRIVAGLSVPIGTLVGVTTVAEKLQTSVSSVFHHMKNLGFIDETEQQWIEDELVGV